MMSEPFDSIGPPAPRGHPWLAWLAIGILAVVFVGRQLTRAPEGAEGEQESELGRLFAELQFRYLVGAADALKDHAGDFYEQARAFNKGPVLQRLRFVTVAGELAGPTEARALLRRLDEILAEQGAAFSPEDKRLAELLQRLYVDYDVGALDAPSLAPDERDEIERRLGWCGRLALHPRGDRPPLGIACAAGAPAAAGITAAVDAEATPGRREALEPARRTFLAWFGTIAAALFLAAIGFVVLTVFVLLLVIRRLEPGVITGATSGGIYAETFAVWIGLFLGLLALAGLWEDLDVLSGVGASMLLSLAALAWPVLRGIPWAQVRRDIGWSAGRQPALEPLFGVMCYLMSIPLLVVGVGIVALVLLVQRWLASAGEGDAFAPTSLPAHPVVEQLVGGDWNLYLKVLVLAAVIAPIVEETMFRGVLYRHLREASARWGWLGSVIFSGTAASFIFAVVHPQGVVAVPLLMALAYGFTIAREWRGTLIPSIAGHAINNALVTTFAFFALS